MNKSSVMLMVSCLLAGVRGVAGDLTVEGSLNVTSNLTAGSISATNGTIQGDGAGITNLNLAAYAGTGLTWDSVSNKLNAASGYNDSNAVSAVSAKWALLTNGLGSAAARDANAFAPSDLSSYASETVTYSNGHFHAASQLASSDVTNAVLAAWPQLDTNASNDLTVAGGMLTGNLNMNSNRVENLPVPQADGDAASKAYLRSVLSCLPPQGNLSMGAYTNGAPDSFPLSF